MDLIFKDIKIPIDFREKCDDRAILYTEKHIKEQNTFKSFGKYKIRLFKRSLDARKRDTPFYVYQTAVSFENDKDLDVFAKEHGFGVFRESIPQIPDIRKMPKNPPCVCGFGPAGMFCALILASAGLRPVVFEKGASVDRRKAEVEAFWKNGVLNPKSNVQFGEGGAGTFSDGKLMTRINDPLCGYVMHVFHECGADSEIMYEAKPHIGSDKLIDIVKNIREKIISLGGEIHFDSEVTALKRNQSGDIIAVEINGSYEKETDSLFLCVGHSARSTFNYLIETGISVSSKPFSVGMRIEHLQRDINFALVGNNSEKYNMPPCDYSLSKRYGERGVYSFCMCPGGTVVASSSELDEIVTNGMSTSKRDGVNANSAIAVSVPQSEFINDPKKAMEYQKRIEKAAFLLGGSDYSAPIQTLGDFMHDTLLNEPKRILPTYTGKTKLCRLSSLFDNKSLTLFKTAIAAFESNIKGFAADDAVLTAPETRTSSPVRINRNESYSSVSCVNLYPAGEGAGYAGGITSAAVDGIKAALKYLESISN